MSTEDFISINKNIYMIYSLGQQCRIQNPLLHLEQLAQTYPSLMENHSLMPLYTAS